jgi:phenylacetate-CoA ligase
MFVKVGALVKNHLPKSVFHSVSGICGYLPQRFVWGRPFGDTYQFLKASEGWSDNEIEAYQLRQIQSLVSHAYEHVPYYTHLLDSHGIFPDEINSLKDFSRIPYLTKELIKEHYDDLISDTIRSGEYIIDYTGGSTCEPMKFLVDSSLIPREMAFFCYAWEKFGFDFGLKYIGLRGSKVARPEKRIFWEYDPLLHRLLMDSDYLSDDQYIRYYIEEMRKFNSPFLNGYPSSIYLLAKHLDHHNMVKEIPAVKLIMLASENTYDWQVEYIKKVFGCENIFYHYGHSEKAALAVKCPHGEMMHFLPQYGYTELIARDGRAALPGELGEIVATSYNTSFPLIRYKTQDYGMVAERDCGCVWGRYPTVSRIEGRAQEFIVTRDQRLISVTSLCAEGLEILSEVLRIQYYQDTEGEVLLKIVPYPGQNLDPDRLVAIKQALEAKVKQSIKVEVQVVPSISPSPSGKRLLMDQKLDVKQYISRGDNVNIRAGYA